MTEVVNFPTAEVAAVPQAPVKKTVDFRGNQVTLKYTLLSLQRLEEAGVPLSVLEKMGDDLSITVLGKVLWAGLCVQFNDATIEEVLNSFEVYQLEQVSEAIAAALSNTVGK